MLDVKFYKGVNPWLDVKFYKGLNDWLDVKFYQRDECLDECQVLQRG